MAMVATIVGKPERISPSLKLVIGTLALDNHYDLGGYLAAPAEFGGRAVKYVFSTAETYYGEWVPATGSLKIIVANTGAEVAHTTNLSTTTAMPFMAIVQAPW